jgi:hypothetical protein
VREFIRQCDIFLLPYTLSANDFDGDDDGERSDEIFFLLNTFIVFFNLNNTLYTAHTDDDHTIIFLDDPLFCCGASALF